jgi:2-methylcitrate dehydratase PrpD
MQNLAEVIAERSLLAKEAAQRGSDLCLCASQHLLDTLAALIVGIRVGSYEALMKSIVAERGSVPIPGTEMKTSAIDAGSIVAYQTNASVFEDGSRYGACHPAAGIFPALWAMGQKAPLLELIQAMVAGYEAMVCIASLGNPTFTQRGFHPTGLCAPFGAAATAGILLKFDLEKMRKALTLASSGSCGLMRAFQEESTQPLHVSHAVRAGLIAALMANQGFSGEKEILERGFLPTFLGYNPQDTAYDHYYFGDTWAIENAYLKPYPGCRHLHPALDAMDQVLTARDIPSQEIDSIKVDTYRVAIETEIHQVKSRGDAYFNMAYALSVRTVLGRADWDAFDVKHLENDEVKGLIDKVQLSIDEDITGAYPAKRGARVTVRVKQGEVFTAFQPLPRGEPELPISFDETAEKFRWEARCYLRKEDIDTIVAKLRGVEGQAREIFEILSQGFHKEEK